MYSLFKVIFFSLFLVSCGMQSIPTTKNEVEAKWAEVQNQYKRRADLIPNLVNVVKGYASHEQETLTKVIEARSKATSINVSNLNSETMAKFGAAQSQLSGALSRLMVVVEKYPDLKANQNFRDLQVQLEGTENRITIARNRYIEVVKDYNNLITVPPTSWFNSLFYKNTKMPQFSVPEEAKVEVVPKVEF